MQNVSFAFCAMTPKTKRLNSLSSRARTHSLVHAQLAGNFSFMNTYYWDSRLSKGTLYRSLFFSFGRFTKYEKINCIEFIWTRISYAKITDSKKKNFINSFIRKIGWVMLKFVEWKLFGGISRSRKYLWLLCFVLDYLFWLVLGALQISRDILSFAFRNRKKKTVLAHLFSLGWRNEIWNFHEFQLEIVVH